MQDIDKIGNKAYDCMEIVGDPIGSMMAGPKILDLFWDIYNCLAESTHQAPNKTADEEIDTEETSSLNGMRTISFNLVLGLVVMENLVEMIKVGNQIFKNEGLI
jgi:hypothetical protein